MSLVGPLARVGRPPFVCVVLMVADQLRILRQPRLADQERAVAGRRDQRFDDEPLRHHAPFLVQLSRERARGVLARINRSARYSKWIGLACRRLFMAPPMPDLQAPAAEL